MMEVPVWFALGLLILGWVVGFFDRKAYDEVQDDHVTRFEVIDHRLSVSLPNGRRVYSVHNARIERMYQDNGKTLKIVVEDDNADYLTNATDVTSSPTVSRT